MSVLLLSSFNTSLIGVPKETLFNSNRLKKALPDQIKKLLKNVNKENHFIYNLPSQIEDIKIGLESNEIIRLSGITQDIAFNESTVITVPFKTIEDTRLKEYETTLNNLANEFNIDIIISKDNIYSNHRSKPEKIYCNIIGDKDSVNTSKSHVLGLLTYISNNGEILLDYLDLESFALLPSCVGSNMNNLSFFNNSLMTDIILPPLITNNQNKPQLILTSPIHSYLLKAKSLLQNHVDSLKDSIFYKRITNFPSAKLLYIKKFQTLELQNLMIKYQSFVKINDNSVEFQSPSLILLNTLIKSFIFKFSQNIVELTIFSNNPIANEIELIKHFNSDLFVLVKSEESPRQFTFITNYNCLLTNECQWLNELNLNIEQLKITFEIHADYEEFISGKKNGKLTRIMESSNCLLTLENEKGTDATMSLSMISESVEDFCASLVNVIDEIPAEESFYIPEVYHRPIIGTGGSIVQTIMRKHNVFIQFSDSYLLPQNKFVITRYDNVIIRCPTKNKQNIKLVKYELMNLVENFNTVQDFETLILTKGRYMNLILNGGSQIISNLEKKNNVYINLPTEYPALDSPYNLQIKGNEKELIQQTYNEIVDNPDIWIKEVRLELSNNFLSYYTTNSITLINEITIPFLETFKTQVSFSVNSCYITFHTTEECKRQIDIISEYLALNDIQIINKEPM